MGTEKEGLKHGGEDQGMFSLTDYSASWRVEKKKKKKSTQNFE